MRNSLLNKYSEIHFFTNLFWKFEEVGNCVKYWVSRHAMTSVPTLTDLHEVPLNNKRTDDELGHSFI